MKKLIIALVLIVGFSINAQEIKWMSLEEAVAAQKVTPKKIMLDAYTVWCGPCKMLDKKTFKNKDVANYVNENFYAVKFNAEGNETVNFLGNTFTNPNFDSSKGNGRNSSHQLSQYFGIRAYPTIVFLDEDANLIAPLPGYKTPQQLELYLKLFKSDDFKTITEQGDWEAYQQNFKYAFKD
ncbi:thioredoxin fold domain-containing protein [Lutibacter sp. TH_r2]|uniref:thioredoxin family protein n=1 Tax=Lutibacter sp. TH_r2 TaxID=3082083 RepID=UPI00295505D3|nr:thioredoxin fold domain-containing protein [Lutibacter sp. TH_r2]MDV7187662.1 thioredoxin fold domain-containing protein [Lutibacter sp. TH_r2]